eukprot:2905653-Karenia_brevis.AAC.1
MPDGDIVFPLKSEYDSINTTLQGRHQTEASVTSPDAPPVPDAFRPARDIHGIQEPDIDEVPETLVVRSTPKHDGDDDNEDG